MKDKETWTLVCPECGADNVVNIRIQDVHLMKVGVFLSGFRQCWRCKEMFKLAYEEGALVTKK